MKEMESSRGTDWVEEGGGKSDFEGADLRNAELSACDLRRANLSGTNLSDTHLYGTNFMGATLRGARLRGATLHHVIFSGANLSDANLTDTVLRGVDFCGTNLCRTDFRHATLIDVAFRQAKIRDAIFRGAFFIGGDLRLADLKHSDLSHANLSGVEFTHARLLSANFSYSNLSHANLHGADLSHADLDHANIVGANFHKAVTAYTKFADCDLHQAVGLDLIQHGGPSTIGIDTIYRSKGSIPESFLRGCGVPEGFITDMQSLVGAVEGIQFYSCFIAYSSKDGEFAKRLHGKMRDANLRVWFAPENIQGGKKLHEQIEAAIRIYDKLLIVLSEASLKSEWVISELRNARATERETGKRKLFPVRLIDFETLRAWKCFDADSGKDLAIELREYFIPDFSNWKDHDQFETAFTRLLQDLKTEARAAR